MKISVLTLFPNFFDNFLQTSIIKRAIDKKNVEIEIINFRDFSKNKHKKVDDTPFGGGAGMVLTLQPIVDAIKWIKKNNSKVILLTPSGSLYQQKKAFEFSNFEHIILICGHYEGFDERLLNYVDYQISIGDYILTSGETASLVVMESIIRLIPNVINNKSLENESFNDYLLDYPNYTKPVNFEGLEVPSVLLEGNHKKIDSFRKEQRILKTKLNRNDLYQKYIRQKGNKNE